MKRVKCKSGIEGWQCRLQDAYDDFEDFKRYCLIWHVMKRLGYNSPEKAWKDNPVIQGSVIPSDLCVVTK